MKKLVLLALILVSVLLVLPGIMADDDNGAETDSDDEDTKVAEAYDCLKGKIEEKNNCEDLSVEEQAFSLLAMAYDSGTQSDCKDELLSNIKNDECWPSPTCRLRETSLAILALDHINADTEDYEDWILSQRDTPTDLIWYLELDSNSAATCEISYDSHTKTVNIGEDKKLSGSLGSCFSLASEYNDYWLKIRDTCYDKNFSITCDEDFLSTLLYRKKSGAGSTTLHVSSGTESAPAEGTTEHKVNTFCFKQGSSCSYEGSLWATLALAKVGQDVSAFLPYLIAMADENERSFPYAFLYMITDYDEYFSDIISEQKSSGYWQVSTDSNKKFYDTALALLSLQGLDAEQVVSSKEYLMEVQASNGCWRNNIRDTAFILYSAWPKSPSRGGGGTEIDDCEDHNYHCTSPLDCDQDDVLDNFFCSGTDICCTQGPAEETCYDKGGIECSSDQQCSGAIVPASDSTDCCLGSCITLDPSEPECEEEGFDCRDECFSDEEEKFYDCGSGDVCCAPKPSEPSPSYWWIWLLGVLILLLVIALIFRKQLRVFLFKRKGGVKHGPGPTRSRPGFPPTPPAGVRQHPRPRMLLPRQPPRRPGPIRKAVSKTDKELDATLKKLKEMSK